MSSSSKKFGLEALLTPQECVLALIDHQPFPFANVHSHEPTMVVNNVAGLAKVARGFKVPTILTAVTEEGGGSLIKGVQDVFPDQKPINRTTLKAREDKRVVNAVKRTGASAAHLRGPPDASGGTSREPHDKGVRRMTQAGATPVTWMGVMSEWQRDWAREATIPAVADVSVAHSGATGIAFLWEMQLLKAGERK
jgi:nicotinamidase-related amidase